MDQIGNITSMLSIDNGILVELDITYLIANASYGFYFQCWSSIDKLRGKAAFIW